MHASTYCWLKLIFLDMLMYPVECIPDLPDFAESCLLFHMELKSSPLILGIFNSLTHVFFLSLMIG